MLVPVIALSLSLVGAESAVSVSHPSTTMSSLTVIMKVDNTKGGIATPSDFTILVEQPMHATQSFSGPQLAVGKLVKLHDHLEYSVDAKIGTISKCCYSYQTSPQCSGKAEYGSYYCTIFAHSWQAPPAKLHITNFIRTDNPSGCPTVNIAACPSDKNRNDMLTTIEVGGVTHNFPAGTCCGEKGSQNYEVPVGQNYKITGKINQGHVSCTTSQGGITPRPPITWPCWTFDKVSIVPPQLPSPVCQSQRSFQEVSCEARMGESGANVQVNYNWLHHYSPLGTPPRG